ncbi:amino acid dehydrogenase [bacterium]|nr:amino acid dehydrogenase [bacterium]
MFDHAAFAGHESVHHFHDREAGLRAIIAIHSTRRGPAAGGCRMWKYASSDAALTDALRLSQGMSYKNAMADLPLGGGKAVIIGDSHTEKSPELFRAFGDAVNSLAGRYWTAEDVGVSPTDMAFAAERTKYVAGLAEGAAASGDPSPVTARGVFLGVKACARQAWGDDDLSGRKVAVQGVGHVGGRVCELLAEAGATLVITDVHSDLLRSVAKATGASVVEPDAIYDQDVDIFSPNALGAILNPETLARLSCRIIAGGANNQLATPDIGDQLAERGLIYAPDYVINGGGIINVASEISGVFDADWVEQKLQRLIVTLSEVLAQAATESRGANRVADEIARRRIGEVG